MWSMIYENAQEAGTRTRHSAKVCLPFVLLKRRFQSFVDSSDFYIFAKLRENIVFVVHFRRYIPNNWATAVFFFLMGTYRERYIII